jgi:hypothetical protein
LPVCQLGKCAAARRHALSHACRKAVCCLTSLRRCCSDARAAAGAAASAARCSTSPSSKWSSSGSLCVGLAAPGRVCGSISCTGQGKYHIRGVGSM